MSIPLSKIGHEMNDILLVDAAPWPCTTTRAEVDMVISGCIKLPVYLTIVSEHEATTLITFVAILMIVTAHMSVDTIRRVETPLEGFGNQPFLGLTQTALVMRVGHQVKNIVE
jgi:hypothetical protein